MTKQPPQSFRREQWRSMTEAIMIAAFLGAAVVAVIVGLLGLVGVHVIDWVHRHPFGILVWAVVATVFGVLSERDAVALRWQAVPDEHKKHWTGEDDG